MAKFDVIEGGRKPRDCKAEIAQQAFETLVIEIIRSLSRGYDNKAAIAEALADFINNVNETEQPVFEIISNTIEEIHEQAFTLAASGESPSKEVRYIVKSSLRLAADIFSNDELAVARISKSQDLLERAIKEKIRIMEGKSRKHGWSYVAHTTEGIPPIESPIPLRKSRKSKARNRIISRHESTN